MVPVTEIGIDCLRSGLKNDQKGRDVGDFKVKMNVIMTVIC